MELLWLLLPVAAASGWLAAKRTIQGKDAAANHTPAYFRGLNYLLNEQPDKAIDVFVKMLEVDSETVETHLALGNLFRRRGEVDRAIRIHQNLIARPTLNRDQRAQALLELGQDYMRAGLFDRAESLFKELNEMGIYQKRALQNLCVIYQQEKEWDNCLSMTRKLEQLTGNSLGNEKAHYYCELAEEALAGNEQATATTLLKKAQASDSECVRATMLQGKMELNNGAYRSALKTFKRVEQQDPDYIAEILPLIIDCYRRQGEREELVSYLRQLFERNHSIAPAMLLAEFLQEDEGDQAAVDFITEYLNRYPNLEGISKLIELNLRNGAEDASRLLRLLQQQLARLLENHAAYQCSRCGFSAKTLHWQCPGCKAWSSIKPHHALEESRP